MKFDTQKESKVEQIGDIKNNNISIDMANVDFIVSILSTNLYSQPVKSLVRETVSNAWDSHVEAGVDDPVVLTLGKDTEGAYYFSIEDFGVGLSEERFNEIYRNIGSSTKRDSNTLIGGFGIGRFSVLAYSDVTYLTSHYDGVMYKYVMYKDEGSISIDLLHSEPTEERNGFKVYVPVQWSDISVFRRAITQQLAYFENLYVQDFTEGTNSTFFSNDFNNIAIKRYKSFSVCSDESIPRLTLGKVTYPIRFESLNHRFSHEEQRLPIALNFEIGDLKVTPNREEILYTKENIEAIEFKMQEAIQEIEDLILAQDNDFDDLQEYIKACENSKFILLDTPNKIINIHVPGLSKAFTYKGEKYDIQKIKSYMGHSLSKQTMSVYKLKHGKFYSHQTISMFEIISGSNEVYFADISNLTSLEKVYLKDHCFHGAIFVKPNLAYWEELTKTSMKLFRTNTRVDYSWKEAKLVLTDRVFPAWKKIKKFSPGGIPSSWIKERKAKQLAARALTSRKTFSKEEFTIHLLRYSYHGTSVTTESTTVTAEKMAQSKGIYIYAPKDNELLRSLFRLLFHNRSKNINKSLFLVEMAPTRVKKLKNIPNCIKIDKFMSVKYKPLRRIATAFHLEKEYPELDELYSISNLDLVSTHLRDVVIKLHKYKILHLSKVESKLKEEIYQLCKDKNYFDEEIVSLARTNQDLMKKALFIKNIAPNDYYSSSKIPLNCVNLVVDYVLARKLFRPNLDAWKKLKKETILNLKPIENED